MVYRDFKFDKIDFYKKKLTKFQHSLKTFMKCYTIKDFKLKEDNTFTFKKSYRINGIRMDDPQEHVGQFKILAGTTNKQIILRLII